RAPLVTGSDVCSSDLYVVVAFDRTFDYRKLDVALQAVRRHGARLIGTNPDRTCPVEGGEIPDAAGMIGAVEGVTGRRVDPIVGRSGGRRGGAGGGGQR